MRPIVVEFAKLMEQRLRENDHKPGWKNDSPLSLAKRIREEYLELLDALAPYDSGAGDPTSFSGDVLGECADVANFAMMVADVTGALTIPSLDPLRDVTSSVEIGDVDGETLSITKCVCGATFPEWKLMISIYVDTPYECPKCGAKLCFENRVRVYQII